MGATGEPGPQGPGVSYVVYLQYVVCLHNVVHLHYVMHLHFMFSSDSQCL